MLDGSADEPFFRHHGWTREDSERNPKARDIQYMIDFASFEKRYWPTFNQKNTKGLSASIVWTGMCALGGQQEDESSHEFSTCS
jgi:hypothetical protein